MRKDFGLALAFIVFMVASCAVITVNIYFPEKDVQQAYKALEKELMAPGAGGEQAAPDDAEAPKSQGSLGFSFVRPAYAQEPGMADKIAQTIKRMPEVVEAYRIMGQMQPRVDALRASGKVGEGNNGLLAPRGQLGPDEQKLMNRENKNRRTVMRGMARAIIRINREKDNRANLEQVLPQAREQFAQLRRSSARPGWWVQDKRGNWFKK